MNQVDIILGLKCNEKCNFCFQNSHYIKKYDKQFIKKDIIKTLIKGKLSGYDMVNISGGEPTIYFNELDFTLKLSHKFGYKMVKLITNGIRFSDTDFALKTLPYITDIGFSFHSSDEYIQDNLTGLKGSFELVNKAIKNIKNLSTVKLHNHCVITSENINVLDKHIKNIISLGFYSIHFMSLMHNTELNKLKTYDFNKLSIILKSIINKYNKSINIEVSYIQQCYMDGYEEYVLGFDYGKTYLSNNENSLSSWEDTMINNKVLKEKCKSCVYLKKCYGFWK